MRTDRKFFLTGAVYFVVLFGILILFGSFLPQLLR